MDTIRDRAKDKFPMVLLTLLSIVQALALEFLWDHARHRPDLLQLTLTSVHGWLQIAATLNVIILIWLMYAGMLMRFRWTPTTTDSVFPFFVGLIQFLMIDIMGEEHFALWVLVAAVTYGLMVFVNHRAMKRARSDPSNQAFFKLYAPATLTDFVPQIGMVIALLASAGWIASTGTNEWFSIAVMVAIFAGLAYETHDASVYWKVSMGGR